MNNRPNPQGTESAAAFSVDAQSISNSCTACWPVSADTWEAANPTTITYSPAFLESHNTLQIVARLSCFLAAFLLLLIPLKVKTELSDSSAISNCNHNTWNLLKAIQSKGSAQVALPLDHPVITPDGTFTRSVSSYTAGWKIVRDLLAGHTTELGRPQISVLSRDLLALLLLMAAVTPFRRVLTASSVLLIPLLLMPAPAGTAYAGFESFHQSLFLASAVAVIGVLFIRKARAAN